MNEKLLKKLEKVIAKKGVKQTSIELGYSSKNTVYKWINDKRIPPIAWEKVSDYLDACR
jgi:hypothetical protein